MTSILDLPQRVEALPTELRAACARIFQIAQVEGQLLLPDPMRAWAAHQFGSVAAVERQQIVKVINRLTLEGALFNPLRALRPATQASTETQIDRWIAEALQDDMFADPLRQTPLDVFGRITGSHCRTASNIAKYDGWHGVIICDEPHPLRFDRAQVQDYLDVAWQWITAAHAVDPQAIYPLISWNCMPKSGASLAHGHLQVALGRAMPYSKVEQWRRAATAYRSDCQRSYSADLVSIHTALGLGLPTALGRGFVSLAPARNREIVLLGSRRAEPQPELADALYHALQHLIHTCGTRAFNAAVAFPPLAEDGLDWCDLPAYARIGDRGDALAIRSDVGVMELYGMSVITVDPYAVIADRAHMTY